MGYSITEYKKQSDKRHDNIKEQNTICQGLLNLTGKCQNEVFMNWKQFMAAVKNNSCANFTIP